MGDGARGYERQGALDGMRALALCLVLFFHAGFDWMSAGYVGVSVFFTLSGYLITNLLLAEHESTNAIRLGSFYSRRWKRLLPASVLCVSAIAALRLTGSFGEVDGLRADLTTATLQVFNWHELTGGSSYSALFATPAGRLSPVTHFWSLAIEEQFYLLWPLALLGILRVARARSVPVVWMVAALTLLFAAAAPLIAWHFGPDAAYWSTPARLGEILVGALLACVLRSSTHRLASAPGSLVAGGSLAVIVAAAVVLPSDGGPAFTGWMTVFALVSATLIVGLQSAGPLRRMMAWRPLVLLGLISYGAYLFHWPVFLVLQARGWALSTPAGFLVAFALTMTLATASYHMLEQPIRHGKWGTHDWRPARVGVAAAALTVAVLLLVAVMPSSRGFLEPDRDLLDSAAIVPAAQLAPLALVTGSGSSNRSSNAAPSGPDPAWAKLPITSTPSTPTVSTTVSTTVPVAGIDVSVVPLGPTPNRPIRVLVVGDSTAFFVGHGLAQWAVEHPDYAQVDLLWSQGFGLLHGGTVTAWDATSFIERSVELLTQDLPALIGQVRPDVVVLMTTVGDVMNREWDQGEGVLVSNDQRFRDRLADSYRLATAAILADGVRSVVWVVPPIPTSTFEAEELEDPATFEPQHDVIRQVVTEFGSAASTIDLDKWMATTHHDADTSWRPDGTHLTDEAAHEIAESLLGPTLVQLLTGPQ